MMKIRDRGGYKSKSVLLVTKASELISKLKGEGKTVGLCHGGFDLLHPGHVKHFESAKVLCDVLFVSITSDHFISLRKGYSRPIYPERLRAFMIANIKCVDYVVISDYKTGIEIIKMLKPDFYIKGYDYIKCLSKEMNAERVAVSSVGGKVRYTVDSKLSTTDIIKYIKSAKF